MIYLGADHRGYQLKEKIKRWLKEWGWDYQDLGNTKYEPEDDYPDFGKGVVAKLQSCKVAKKEKKDSATFGILICGSGIGMSIVANRFPGVRCGLGFSAEQVKRGREEDGINCLALPADFITEQKAKAIIKVFLETKFLGKEKYQRRIEKIEKNIG